MSDKELDDCKYVFPESRETWGGMLLRDYFAAKAMQAALTNHNIFSSILPMAKSRDEDPSKWVAEFSYEYADAMIQARKPNANE